MQSIRLVVSARPTQLRCLRVGAQPYHTMQQILDDVAVLIAANFWQGGKRWRWSSSARVAGRILFCGPRAPAPSHTMASGA